MKSIISFLIVILTGANCLSQSFSSLAVFISEDENGKPIASASIIIKEAGWASKTTGSDGKAFFDKSMPIGEIKYIVSKEGFQGEEGTFNITTEEKSNTLNIKLTKFQYEKLLINGKITDEQNKNLVGALVEIKYADIIKTATTDQSGNYSVELTLNQTRYPDNILRFEVTNGAGCKKSEIIDLTRKNIIYKDFRLDCPMPSELPPKKDIDGKLDLPKYFPVYIYGYRSYDHFREMPLLNFCIQKLGHKQNYIHLNACGSSINYAPSKVDYKRKYYVEYATPYNDLIAFDFINEITAFLSTIFKNPEMPFKFDFEFVPKPVKTGGDAPNNNIKILLDDSIETTSKECNEVADTTLLKFVRVFELAAKKMEEEVEKN